MASARKLVYQISTALIVLLFTVSGIMKLTPIISPEFHGKMKRDFHIFARVPPIDILRLDPDVYRVAIGVIELSCVAAILFLRPRLQVLANYMLLIIMVGALYTHYSIGDPLKEMGGAIFGLVIVLARLYTAHNLYYFELKLKET